MKTFRNAVPSLYANVCHALFLNCELCKHEITCNHKCSVAHNVIENTGQEAILLKKSKEKHRPGCHSCDYIRYGMEQANNFVKKKSLQSIHIRFIFHNVEAR